MNPASRVLAIYDKALAFPVTDAKDGRHTRFIELWSDIFGIARHKGHQDEDAVTTCLMTFRDEIELAQTRLLECGCPRELFVSHFSRVKAIASATVLPQEWRQHKNGLPTDVRLALAWAAWVSPDEEKELSELSPDELSSLTAELDSIEQAIESSGLSEYVRDFVSRQIDLIRAALRQYTIAGIAPVEKALEQTIGALARERTTLVDEFEAAPPEGKTVLARFKAVVDKTVNAAEKADKVYKGGKAIAGIARALGEAWDHITRLLPPPS